MSGVNYQLAFLHFHPLLLQGTALKVSSLSLNLSLSLSLSLSQALSISLSNLSLSLSLCLNSGPSGFQSCKLWSETERRKNSALTPLPHTNLLILAYQTRASIGLALWEWVEEQKQSVLPQPLVFLRHHFFSFPSQLESTVIGLHNSTSIQFLG